MGSILVPLNDVSAVESYVNAGAEEFYFGFYDPAWSAAFGPEYDLNRMSGFGHEANAYSFQEALWVCSYIHSLGYKTFITFNAAVYSAKVHGLLAYYFDAFAAAGADGVILSGPELIDTALNAGLAPVASTMCGIYNADIAKFYARCGMKRMILPRELSIEEIAAIVGEIPHAQFEVFLMRNGCVYSDGNCLGTHNASHGALCGELKAATRRIRTSLDTSRVAHNSNVHCKEFHARACGLCALWDFEQLGINAYKIVGRSDDADAICADIEIVKQQIEIASSCKSREEFLHKRLAHPYESIVCDRGLNCYYPELRGWDTRTRS